MKTFFRQLRDRHVVKIAIAYLVTAWVVLQLADVIFPAMNLPDWTITLTLGLLAAGFPVALVLAWVFDLTPEGIQRTDTAAPTTVNSEPEGTPAGRVAADIDPLSIAVLPFPDMSAEQNQEHFCDGLTEELLSMLTRIPNLRVASQTSSFAFKGKKSSMAEVAEKLRVAHVLEGSVRKDGNRIRVNAQLIEVATDSHLWSETYDRELSDIFAIQNDIAGQILDALKIRFGSEQLPDPSTRSIKAYEYFLHGKGHSLTRTKRDVERAIVFFQKAVEEDPGFQRAWIALAEQGAMHAIFLGGGDPSCEIACAAADRAMAIAPHRAESFMTRGFSHLAAHRYQQAEQDFLQALKIDPRQHSAYHYLARAAHHQGHSAEELHYFSRATALDPEDWESPLLSVSTYLKKNDRENALLMARIGVERVQRHLQDYPDNPRAYYLALGGLEMLGEVEQAAEWADRALALTPDDPPTRYNLACFYARQGQAERALDLLEGSIHSRSWIENDPDMDSIRNHPRYQTFIQTLVN